MAYKGEYGTGTPEPCDPFEADADFGNQGMRKVLVISKATLGFMLSIPMGAFKVLGEGFKIVTTKMSNGEESEMMIHESRLHDR